MLPPPPPPTRPPMPLRQIRRFAPGIRRSPLSSKTRPTCRCVEPSDESKKVAGSLCSLPLRSCPRRSKSAKKKPSRKRARQKTHRQRQNADTAAASTLAAEAAAAAAGAGAAPVSGKRSVPPWASRRPTSWRGPKANRTKWFEAASASSVAASPARASEPRAANARCSLRRRPSSLLLLSKKKESANTPTTTAQKTKKETKTTKDKKRPRTARKKRARPLWPKHWRERASAGRPRPTDRPATCLPARQREVVFGAILKRHSQKKTINEQSRSL